MTLTLTAIVLVVVLAGGYACGQARARRIRNAVERKLGSVNARDPAATSGADAQPRELARIVRSYECECAGLRKRLATAQAANVRLEQLAADRRSLFGELAQARADTARYRQLVVDTENSAPPPLLGGRGTPDDLKLIVGIGPMLERMLHQLGITTYRQIARWSERDIDEFDARLAEFRGRIRRDAWVTQARALHQSVHGEAPVRERG